jgi:hypothetical protein
MTTYTLTLSTAEDKALAFAAVSQNEWIQNVVQTRCNAAVDEIVALTVQKCLETNTPIPGSKDAMVDLAFAQGWVKTAAQRQAEAEAEAAARLGQNETNTNV